MAHRSRRATIAPQLETLETRTLLNSSLIGDVGLFPLQNPVSSNTLLIRFADEATPQLQSSLLNASGAYLVNTFSSGSSLISFFRPMILDAAIRALEAHPDILFAERNETYTLQGSYESDDPVYTNGGLWGMYGENTTPQNIYGSHAGEAWAAGNIGSHDVLVGIIDTGIDIRHPDLAANIWVNPFDSVDGVDNDGNGYIDDIHGWNFYHNNNTVFDNSRFSVDYHGTHIAGTIGAVGGNGTGVAGVNWQVTMIVAKFFGPLGLNTTAGAIAAIDYITDLKTRHNLNIVATNSSWGGGYSQAMHDAIIRAAKADILFVAAAGNDGRNNDTNAFYPANYDTTVGTSSETAASYNSVIAVAALDSNGNLASFSNYGANTVHLAAPGAGINSTLPNGNYGTLSGTSMAAPHVTGAAALYAAANPRATAKQIRDAILSNVIPTDSLQGKTVTGGRLNVNFETTAPSDPTEPEPPAAPTNLVAEAVSTSKIELSWNSVEGAESYQVERSLDGSTGWTRIAETTGTTWTDSGLQADTTYDYRVRAANAAGFSDYSEPVSATTPAASAVLFADDFQSGIGSAWTFRNGVWTHATENGNGILKQTSTSNANEKKAMVTDQAYPAVVEIVARMRVDSWRAGELARAGIGAYTNLSTGQGYNLVFTGRHGSSQNRVEFLDDGHAWSGWDVGQGGAGSAGVLDFAWEVGVWYWFRLRVEPSAVNPSSSKLSGKVWQDGTAEPNDWQLVFDAGQYPKHPQNPNQWTRTGGAPALNGGSAGHFPRQGPSYATASFDDVTVIG